MNRLDFDYPMTRELNRLSLTYRESSPVDRF